MKIINSIIGLFVITGTLAAQLTPDQRAADLTALASIYAKQYAPANWKILALGSNLFYLSPWLDKARAARSDIEFLEICAQYVSTFQDGHTQFYAPGNFTADLGIVVDLYDGKVLIEAIDRFALPLRQYPFEKGDELVSVDGRPVADWIDQYSKLHTYANPRYTRRIATDALTFRWQQEIAAAGLLGDEAAIQIRRASGVLETYKIAWQKDGTPITRLATMPGFFGREPQRGREYDLPPNNGDTEIPLWQQLHEQRKTYAISKKRDPLRQGEWTDPDTGEKADRRAYTGYGSNRPIWDYPEGFQIRLGRSRNDFITTGTYKAEGKTIGYLRIGQFNSVSTSMFNQLDAEINFFNTNTDGLVVMVSTALDYHRFCTMLLNGGELDGARVIGRKTLELMTLNHLPGNGDLATWSQSLFSEATNAGVGFGLGFAINIDPAANLIAGSLGEYYWGGMFSTAFFVDPVEKVSMVFMTQLSPSSTYPIRRELKTLIYAALT